MDPAAAEWSLVRCKVDSSLRGMLVRIRGRESLAKSSNADIARLRSLLLRFHCIVPSASFHGLANPVSFRSEF